MIGVIGFGLAGESVTKLLIKLGEKVFVSEKSIDEEKRKKLNSLGVEYELGKHSDKLFRCSLIIKSPGVPPTEPIIKKLMDKKIKVIDEIEFAYQHLKGYKKLIAVTGTNGKSTVVKLIGEIFRNKKLKSYVCGNIGEPLSSIIDKSKNSYLIVEVSSFQLQFIEKFRPDISCILNITPDHLDYHMSFNEYIEAKKNIFKNQTKNDICILNYDYEVLRKSADECPAKVVWFSIHKKMKNSIYGNNNKIYINLNNKEEAFKFTSHLPGKHNLENILVATIVAYLCDIDIRIITSTIEKFKGLEHRIELVREINGIKFINDSKSTNPDSTRAAIESFEQPIHLIMGGKEKGLSYEVLKDIIKKKVKALYLIGETSKKMYKDFHKLLSVYNCVVLQNAVKKAYENSKKSEIILFSPGTSSFDQFRDFKQRGETFKKIVMNL